MNIFEYLIDVLLRFRGWGRVLSNALAFSMPKITKRYAKCSSQRANPRVVIDLFEVNWKSALSGRVSTGAYGR